MVDCLSAQFDCSQDSSTDSSHSGKNEPEQTPRALHGKTISHIANGNTRNNSHYPLNINSRAERESNFSASSKEFGPKSEVEVMDPLYIPSPKKTSALWGACAYL